MMGRQLPIAATATDECELLIFMRTLSPIRVYVSLAQTIDALWIDDWGERDIEGCGFKVWLQSFPWVPEYKQTGGPRCPKGRRGLWYVSNDHHAPVIEVSRPLPDSNHGGRIYWAHDFGAPDGLAYDAAEFSQYVDRIWNWIRRNSRRRLTRGKRDGPYCLPDAWSKVGG
jgi:hypothetical protein